MGRSKTYTTEVIRKEAALLLTYAEAVASPKIPLLSEFASQRKYPRENLGRWAKELTKDGIQANPEMADAVLRLKDLQEAKLCEYALHSVAPVAFCIFMLKALAGWRDVPEQGGGAATPSVNITIIRDSTVTATVQASDAAPTFTITRPPVVNGH
jgi:hypothetical protein